MEKNSTKLIFNVVKIEKNQSKLKQRKKKSILKKLKSNIATSDSTPIIRVISLAFLSMRTVMAYSAQEKLRKNVPKIWHSCTSQI